MRNPWSYVTPIKSDGTHAVAAATPGFFTVEANTTYYLPFSEELSRVRTGMSAHIRFSLALVVTSCTMQDTNAQGDDITDYETALDSWTPIVSTTVLATDKSGGGVTLTANVASKTGGAVGSTIFNHLGSSGRSRLALVVGSVGGEVSCGLFVRQ